jgi:hypothetical protein
VRPTVYHVPVARFVLNVPIVSSDTPEQLSHYTRAYYIAAMSEPEAVDIVRNDAAAEGATLVDAETPVETTIRSVPGRFRDRLLAPRLSGVIWKSGRVFFPPD